MQRSACPPSFADIKSISKDFSPVAICIYLHACLKMEPAAVVAWKMAKTLQLQLKKIKRFYLKGIVFHQWYVLLVN